MIGGISAGVSVITGAISQLITWILNLFLTIFSIVLSGILSAFSGVNIPAFETFSSYLQSFWDFVFSCIGYARSALLIDQFEWNLLITILSLKLLYKPTIALIKMFVKWYDKLKL